MKRTIAALTIGAGIMAMVAAGHVYPEVCVVTSVTEGGAGADDVVNLTTSTMVVHIARADDLEVGDMVGCIMWDNGTPDSILDDVVLSVRYTSYEALR